MASEDQVESHQMCEKYREELGEKVTTLVTIENVYFMRITYSPIAAEKMIINFTKMRTSGLENSSFIYFTYKSVTTKVVWAKLSQE